VGTKASYAAPYIKGQLQVHDEEKIIEIARLIGRMSERQLQKKSPEKYDQESKRIWDDFDTMIDFSQAALYALGKISPENPNTRIIGYAINPETFDVSINEEPTNVTLTRIGLYMDLQAKIRKVAKRIKEKKKAGVPQELPLGAIHKREIGIPQVTRIEVIN